MALGGAAGGDGLIGFEAGQRRTTTRLLDGEYPKVTSIFPTSVDTESVIETAALVEAVRRVSLVAERNTPVRLKFTDGQVAIEAGTGDDAQASEAVEATLTGPDIEIAFNPHFLLDGLGAVGTTYARLSFTQPSRPAVLTGQAEADGDSDDELPLRPHAGAFRQLSRKLSPLPYACGGGSLTPQSASPHHLAGRDLWSQYRPPALVGRSSRKGQPCSSVSSVSARWAATCASGCAAPVTRSSASTATPRSPTCATMAAMVKALDAPRTCG